MIEGEARFPGRTPLIRALTMQRSIIEGPYGPYTMKVAVEAKDEGRKLDIGAFDALCQEYRGECRVLVDKFVIVTRKGFTKGVKEKSGAARC